MRGVVSNAEKPILSHLLYWEGSSKKVFSWIIQRNWIIQQTDYSKWLKRMPTFANLRLSN